MLNLRPDATKYRKEICNGKDTLFWYDPSLKEGRVVELLDTETPQMTGTQNWKVCNLINNDTWTLTFPALSPIWSYIENVRISPQNDKWLWTVSKNGIFSFSSAWNSVRISSPPLQLKNVIWFPLSSPSMSSQIFIRQITNKG